MKKTLSILLVLVLVLGFALSAAAAPKARLQSVKYKNNAYITMTALSVGSVSFEYGVKNPGAIADPLTVDLSLVFNGEDQDGINYNIEDVTLTGNDPFFASFTQTLQTNYPLRMSMVLKDGSGNIIKMLFIDFTPPLPQITITISQSPIIAVPGQTLTLTATTLINGAGFLADNWGYLSDWTIYNPSYVVVPTTHEEAGIWVSQIVINDLTAIPGTYEFAYSIQTDVYTDYGTSQTVSVTVP